MDNSNLPRLAYYTLKQAVAELNNHFHRTDLDESYLIQLGATGSIKLSIVESVHNRFICDVVEVGDEVERLMSRAIAHAFVSNESYTLFLNLQNEVIRELSLKGVTTQECSKDFFIYDPNQVFFNSRRWDWLIPFQCENRCRILSEDQKTQLLNSIINEINRFSVKTGSFLEFDLPSLLFWIGIGHAGSPRVPNSSEDNEEWEYPFIQDLKISSQDLFIIRPELERIFNNDLRSLTHDSRAGVRTSSKWKRFPEAVFSACKALGYDSLALPSGVGNEGLGVRGEIRRWLGTQQEYADLAAEEATFKRYYQQLKTQKIIKFI